MSKICKTCLVPKADEDFYTSNRTVCKTCVRAQVRANREAKIDQYQAYDRKRYRESDERKAAARKSAASPAGIASRERFRLRMKGTEKRKAHHAVSNAIRDGKLERGTACFFCGSSGKLHAHHHDYSKPLDVFWLCPPCHGKLHTVNGDFLRSRGAE